MVSNMKAALIDKGVVANIIVVDSLDALPDLVDAQDAAIGDLWDGTAFTKPQPEAPAAPTVADFERALDAHLDAKAQERRYRDRVTCAMRAGFTGPFQAECLAFAQWMDACNVYAYAQLAAVQAGQRPPPASVEAFVDELPDLIWPIA